MISQTYLCLDRSWPCTQSRTTWNWDSWRPVTAANSRKGARTWAWHQQLTATVARCTKWHCFPSRAHSERKNKLQTSPNILGQPLKSICFIVFSPWNATKCWANWWANSVYTSCIVDRHEITINTIGTGRIMEMKKGSRAAGIGKGSAPKKRSNRADETDQDWSTSKIKFKKN